MSTTTPDSPAKPDMWGTCSTCPAWVMSVDEMQPPEWAGPAEIKGECRLEPRPLYRRAGYWCMKHPDRAPLMAPKSEDDR